MLIFGAFTISFLLIVYCLETLFLGIGFNVVSREVFYTLPMLLFAAHSYTFHGALRKDRGYRNRVALGKVFFSMPYSMRKEEKFLFEPTDFGLSSQLNKAKSGHHSGRSPFRCTPFKCTYALKNPSLLEGFKTSGI
jgi:hypothetical protein